MRVLPAVLALAVFAFPLSAQTKGDHVVPTLRSQWTPIIGHISTAAAEMPEAKYAYRPTAGVRSFGELIGHIAGAQNMICAAILGDPTPSEDAVEKSATTKAQIIAALRASTAYCAKAYAISDASTRETVMLWGELQSKFWALSMNTLHDGEHYGNIITYLRMNDMVPPSSRGQ